MSKKTADEHIRLETCSLHIRVRAFAAFGDETVDPRRYNGRRDRAELEHGIVKSADVHSGFFQSTLRPRLRELSRAGGRRYTAFLARDEV